MQAEHQANIAESELLRVRRLATHYRGLTLISIIQAFSARDQKLTNSQFNLTHGELKKITEKLKQKKLDVQS